MGGRVPSFVGRKNFVFQGGRTVAIRAMDTGNNSGWSGRPFESFTDDLQNNSVWEFPPHAAPSFGNAVQGEPEKLEVSEQVFGEDVSSVCSPSIGATDRQGHRDTSAAPQDPVVSGSSAATVNFGAALSVAFNSVPAETPKQVWETGIWKSIFDDDDSGLDYNVWGPPAYRPSPALWGITSQDAEPEIQGSKKRDRSHTCNYMDVVSFKPDVPWPEQRDADLQRSIKLWVAVTSRWSDRCSLSSKLDEMRDASELYGMFAHVFSGRAPVTIRKRGAAVLKLCDYLEQNALENFPMQELTFYRFLCNEKNQGAPASRLQGYMQSIAFCRHVLDVTELQEILNSKRCSGVSREETPKERKQASPLKVNELLKLHETLENGADDWDSVFAGATLLCCYCRGRWGDLMRSETAFVDYTDEGAPAFLETRTGRHKTMSSQMHRHQFLPMVAPVTGVNGKDWATPWVQLRQKMGIQFPPDGLIMPAPNRDGGISERPLESGECGKWLRRLLGVDLEPGLDPNRRVSSHSLKCTFLSFAAKRGLSVPDRLMLGYHASQMHMAMVYSRDGAAASLLLLEKMIGEIVKGSFRPDSTRSGRIIEVPDETPETQPVIVKEEIVISSEDECVEPLAEEDSSDSTSDSGTDSEIPEDHGLNKVFGPPQPPEGYKRWQHSKLKTLHLTEPGYVRVFVCGRSVGSFHHMLEHEPRFDSPVCWACFKKAQRE